jgi:rare lipoprotein A
MLLVLAHIIALVPLHACQAHWPRPRHDNAQYGIASYYARKFNGRLTYTDEVFDEEKLTAASNTLRMNTWVRVTNLRNKRSVVVRINDRMHPLNKRLIDLSRAAAAELGFLGRGLTRVKVEVIKRPRRINRPSYPSRRTSA